VEVADLSFPRKYVLILPAYGEPTHAVRELIERIREHAAELASQDAASSSADRASL
jgi:hypothetical protein